MTNIFDGFVNGKFMVLSPRGIKVQIFIAFAYTYTYHYLNSFSKTSIIGWRDSLNQKISLNTGLLWVAAVVLYLYDLITGFVALYFLSILQVLFELPLNVVTIKSLYKPA